MVEPKIERLATLPHKYPVPALEVKNIASCKIISPQSVQVTIFVAMWPRMAKMAQPCGLRVATFFFYVAKNVAKSKECGT